MLYLLRTYHYALFAPYLELHLKDPNLWTFSDILANVQIILALSLGSDIVVFQIIGNHHKMMILSLQNLCFHESQQRSPKLLQKEYYKKNTYPG